MTDSHLQDQHTSGIIEVDGERWVPGSQRPDGTYRSPIKVRPGYTPLEDIPRYQVPSLRGMPEGPRLPPGSAPPGSKPIEKPTKKVSSLSLEKNSAPVQDKPIEKQIRALEKKLRQIDELKQKVIRGEKLNEEQQTKLSKAKELRRELEDLRKHSGQESASSSKLTNDTNSNASPIETSESTKKKNEVGSKGSTRLSEEDRRDPESLADRLTKLNLQEGGRSSTVTKQERNR